MILKINRFANQNRITSVIFQDLFFVVKKRTVIEIPIRQHERRGDPNHSMPLKSRSSIPVIIPIIPTIIQFNLLNCAKINSKKIIKKRILLHREIFSVKVNYLSKIFFILNRRSN